MVDFEAPPGPPPPKVPEGWVARWNDQYKEWFYVNTYTRKSQWDKPTAPARPPPEDDGPDGPPPSYTPSSGPTTATGDAKTNPFTGNRGPASQEEEDERLARQLQEEERARASDSRGASASYPNTPLPPGSFDDEPPREGDSKQRGLLGKLFGRNNGGSRPAYSQQPPYGAGAYGHGGGYGPQAGYGPPPPAGYGPPPPAGYGPPPPGGYYGGGYAQPLPEQQQSSGGLFGGGRSGRGGGMSTAGAAALGLGGGLIGGMLLEDAIQGHDQSIYQQGFDNGEMADGGYGGGGGDFGDGGF